MPGKYSTTEGQHSPFTLNFEIASHYLKLTRLALNSLWLKLVLNLLPEEPQVCAPELSPAVLIAPCALCTKILAFPCTHCTIFLTGQILFSLLYVCVHLWVCQCFKIYVSVHVHLLILFNLS